MSTRVLFTEDKKAGNPMSLIVRIPVPPSLIGSVHKLHWKSLKLMFVIDSKALLKHESNLSVISLKCHMDVVRTMNDIFGIQKQCCNYCDSFKQDIRSIGFSFNHGPSVVMGP